MIDLQTFVLESAKNESTKLFVLPRWGEDRPIELTVIDSAQRNAAQKKATRPSKDGLTRDMHEFQCQICLAGIKNVPFTDVKFINSADEINTVVDSFLNDVLLPYRQDHPELKVMKEGKEL